MRISLDKAYRTKDGDEVLLRKYEKKDDSYSGVILEPSYNHTDTHVYWEAVWDCFGKCIELDRGLTELSVEEDLVEVEEE